MVRKEDETSCAVPINVLIRLSYVVSCVIYELYMGERGKRDRITLVGYLRTDGVSISVK